MSEPKIKKSVLFLGYDNKQTILIDELIKKDCNVFCFKNEVENFENYDLVISFGYRHIIKKEIIERQKYPLSIFIYLIYLGIEVLILISGHFLMKRLVEFQFI